MRIVNPGFLQVTVLALAGMACFETLKPDGQLGLIPVTVRTFCPDLQVTVLDGVLADGAVGVAVGVGFGEGFSKPANCNVEMY
jgi:hypothetical protein